MALFLDSPWLIDDIFMTLCHLLPLTHLKNMMISHHHYQVILQTSWFQPFRFSSFSHYQQRRLILKHAIIDLSRTKITDEGVKYLGACHTLYLRRTKITDEGVKYLGACHTLHLRYTKITDEGVKYLGACHTLDLSCTKITDEGVKYLGACHTLDLSCIKITNEGVKYLGACHTLDLR